MDKSKRDAIQQATLPFFLWTTALGTTTTNPVFAFVAHAKNPITTTQATLKLACASDLQFVLPPLCQLFTQKTGVTVQCQFGSSGIFAKQIAQGLPMDFFLSADETLIKHLEQQNLTYTHHDHHSAVYGIGRLVWLMNKSSALSSIFEADWFDKNTAVANWKKIDGLVNKMAIANPIHAPYGKAAQQALESMGLWQMLQPKLVLGENISQTTQFITTGAADIGITALSMALAPQVSAVTRFVRIPVRNHLPLVQRMVVLKNTKQAEHALALFDFLQSPQNQLHWAKFGFDLA